MHSTSLLHGEITDQILGCFFPVHRGLGFGFLESNYVNSLAFELGRRRVPFRREVPVEVRYCGVAVGTYRCDLVVADKVLVEVKATKAIVEADERQLLNYLRATNLEVGLLLHFGPSPKYERLVYSNDRKG